MTARSRPMPIGAITAGLAVALALAFGDAPAASRPAGAPATARGDVTPVAAMPIRFVANRGQYDPSVRFAAIGRGGTLFATDDALVLVAATDADGPARPIRVRLAPVDTAARRPAGGSRIPMAERFGRHMSLRGLGRLPGVVHVLHGADPAAWRRDILTYTSVLYSDVAPGIDLHIAPTDGPGGLGLALDIAPGADLGALRIAIEDPAVRRGSASPHDDIVPHEDFVKHDDAFLPDDLAIGTHVGDAASDALAGLALIFATYLGGAHRFGDIAYGLAVDATGSAFVTGSTYSVDFPVVGAAQGTNAGESDAFVAKLSPDGTAILYATYLGGGGLDEGRGIAVDAFGRAHVTGQTRSRDFPTTGGLQTALAGAQDAFAVVLDPSGGALRTATYFGGKGDETGNAVAAAADGSTVLVGETSSRDLPLAGALQRSPGGALDAFVARFAAGGTSFDTATYLGGAADDSARAVVLDSGGDVVVAGASRSANLPGIVGGALGTPSGGDDAFVARLSSDGAAVRYAALVGGAQDDVANGVAVDGDGRAVLVGVTSSSDLPIVHALQPNAGGMDDGFLARLAADGRAIDLATYHGGSGDDALTAVASGVDGVLVVAGSTASNGFPTGASTFGPGGQIDAIAMRLSPAGDAFAADWSARLGGTDNEAANAVGVDGAGGATIAGYTRSDDLPHPSGVQPNHGGGSFDAFVARLGDPDAVLPTPPPTVAADGSIRMAFARLEGGAVASDAASIAATNQSAERFAVWRANRLGGDAARIVSGPDDVLDPVWHPDCRRIIYARGKRPVDATARPTRAASPTPTSAPTATPTNPSARAVGVADEGDEGPASAQRAAHKTTLKAAQPASRQAARPAEEHPAEVVQDDEPFDLWIVDADGANATALTRTAWSEREPSVAPDGARIAFAADRGGQWDIYTVAVDGSDPQRLTTSALDERAPAWSPDGTRIAYTCTTGQQTNVCVMNADGSDVRQLVAQSGVDESDPAWSPDGATVAYRRAPVGGGDGDIWVVGADGANPRAVVTGQDDARDPAFAPDGALTFSSDGTPVVFDITAAVPARVAAPEQAGRSWIWEADLGAVPRLTVIRRILGAQPALCQQILSTPEPSATPTDEAPDTPSPTPTRTPSALGAGLFLSVCCPILDDLIPPSLHVRDGAAMTRVRTSRYVDRKDVAFTDLPALAPGTHFVVRLDGQPGDAGQLLRWQSTSLDVAPGERRDLGEVRIEPVALRTPNVRSEPNEAFPDFTFVPRGVPSDRYIVVVRDAATGEAVWSSEPLPAGSDHLSLAGIPLTLDPDREYAWGVVIASAGGGVGVGGPRGSLYVASGPGNRPMPRPTRVPPRTHASARLAQGFGGDPLGLPLAMNRHTPGRLVGFESLGGIVLGGIYEDRPDPIRGPGETGIQVQNLAPAGGAASRIKADFYEQYDPSDPGETYDAVPALAHIMTRAVEPGAAANIYLPGTILPFPASYSALIDGHGAPLAAIYRADWPTTGGAALYSNVAASDNLVVPLVVRHFRGQDSIVTIQNLSPPGSDTRPVATVHLMFYAAGHRDVAARLQRSIRQGQSVTVDLGSVLPSLAALGEEFSGSLRIEADSLVGAQALVAGGPHSVSGFEGVPEDQAAETLFVPLFRAGQAGPVPGDSMDTGISVVNPGNGEVEVNVTFYPTSDPAPALAACRAQPSYVQRAKIAGRSSAIFYQGKGGRADIEPPMPAPCYGSAVIRSEKRADSRGVLAIVQDGLNGVQLLSAYNAVPATQAATTVALPLWRNDHSAYHLTTGIQVMNTGTVTARGVSITFRTTERDGTSREIQCGAACQADIPPGGAHTFWPGDPRFGIPRGTYGAALVKSPEPVAVIVNDFPLTGAVDAAAYNGIPMP